MAKKKKSIPRICDTCNRQFFADAYDVKIGWARFCSKGCAAIAMRGIVRNQTKLSPTEYVLAHSQPVPHCGCWIWDWMPSNRGYGRAKYHGTNIAAHRFSWQAFKSAKVPDGMVVMHSCDTPMCVNPDHLHVGTQKENMEDRDRKGRHRVNKIREEGQA